MRKKMLRLFLPLFFGSVFYCSFASPASAQESTIKGIVGLWGGQQSVPSPVSGPLKIYSKEGGWKAKAGGAEVSVNRHGEDIEFSLPNSQGRFRGHSSRSETITGYWIQPPGLIRDTEYATPVQFKKVGSSWIGNIHSLPDQCTLFIYFQNQSNGQVSGTIRNPEAGWLSRETYQVEMHGDVLSLKGKTSTFDAKYERASDTIVFSLPNRHLSQFILTRQDPSRATRFYPRDPKDTKSYSYLQPVSVGDGWTTSTLDQVGIRPAPISQLISGILSSDPLDQHNVLTHSILIARHGRLVLEEYFYGFGREEAHDTRSAGKSFAPILVDIARRDGFQVEPETPIYSVFKTQKGAVVGDTGREKITVENLMDMTSGLACDDNDNSSPGNEDVMWSQSGERDFYKYTLDLPTVREPGNSAAVYCSGSLNLVGGVAQQVSHRWLGDLFRELADSLSFRSYYLNLSPNGDVYMGGGSYLRPRDELKLGQLFLSRGLWNGHRVLDADWVDRTSTPHSTFFRKVADIETQHEYGYGVHIHTIRSEGKAYKEFGAEGNGGQVVMVLPELDLVVAINGGAYGRSSDWAPWVLRALSDYIIPAVIHGK